MPVAEQPYAGTTCPSCGVELVPPPKAKKACRACGTVIVVRSGPDDRRHLLSEATLAAFELWVAEAATARSALYQQAFEQAEKEWARHLEAAGFQLGEADLDVVDTERHQWELAGIMAASMPGKSSHSALTSAILARDPLANGRRPVRVVIHGLLVGYLDPDDASDIQRRLAAAEKAGRPYLVQAKVTGGWQDDRGRPAPLRIVLVDVPETW